MQQFLLNPYKVGPPVVGTDFYGRQSLLFKVREALRTSNVVLLQGQRRIGKTSFLKQLSVFLNAPQQEHFVAAIFDIQRYIQDTLPQFQLHLANAIAKALQLPVPSLAEWEADYTLFRDTWLPQVYERLGGKKLVILVDEFDNLEGQTAPQAMQTLIPFLGQLVSGETQLKWVLTLGRQTGKLPIQYDPIISVGVQFRMSFLSLEETRQLVEKPTAKIVDYQPDAIARIYQLTNGQPHLTQALCSELFQWVVLEQERESVSKEDVDAVIPHTLEAYSSAIASIVRVPPIEERVLVAVAQLSAEKDTTNREEIINLLVKYNIQQINRDDLTAALDSLLDWELLSGDIQAMRVSVELVRMWLVQNLSVEPNPQESLDIQHILAQSRFELAEQLRQAGQYERAIEDYKETLNYIPSHVEALRGLAEAYRLTGNLAERVNTLQKLYAFERSILNEFVEALADYAKYTEKERNYVIAAEQYEKLIKLQNCDRWQQKIQQNLTAEYSIALDEVEESLNASPRSDAIIAERLFRLSLAEQSFKQKWNEIPESVIEIFFACCLENSEHRIYIIQHRIKLREATKQHNWKKAARLLLVLQKSGLRLSDVEISIIFACISMALYRLVYVCGFLLAGTAFIYFMFHKPIIFNISFLLSLLALIFSQINFMLLNALFESSKKSSTVLKSTEKLNIIFKCSNNLESSLSKLYRASNIIRKISKLLLKVISKK